MHLPGLLRFALTGKPLELKFLYSKELVRKIKQLVSSVDFDIVQIEPSRMAFYLETLPSGARYKCILVFHNVTSNQYDRIFQIEPMSVGKMRTRLYSWMMQSWEPRYAEQFDRCIAMSEADRYLLTTANSRLKVDVIPNGVDAQMYQPLSFDGTQPALLFIGTMSYQPCIDAALYFVAEILPHITRAVPNVETWIVGRDPSPQVVQLNGNGVHVTGRVDDVRPYYSRSTVCVVPLRAGGGTRLKILEAMALGRPVVSTTIGCEGLDVVDGEHLLIADNPEQFAEKIIHLLKDKAFYQSIVLNARQLVVDKYDWDVIAEQLLDLYDKMGPQRASRDLTH
jgi:glycosyltransferase involved in cell wall biosynthesis